MIPSTNRGGGGRCALPLFFLTFLMLVGGVTAGALSGQTIQGQVLDRETMEPVEGVLVLLLGPDGTEHDGYLTNSVGRFILRAPGPGTYLVRADRIGYETTSSEAFDLSRNQIFGLRMEVAETAIQLDELRVEGEQQCVVRPEEGLQVARVWEEAQKALTVQDWTEREGLYHFQVLNYERDLDEQERRVESETRQVLNGVARSPIRSLPAEELMEKGWIQQDEGGNWTYYGPDANVLLSDEFLDTHCFHLQLDQEHPASVGLAFEPIQRGENPDIQGTLWLDGATGALQFLEYRYNWSEYPEAQGVARGRVEFEALPNGAWIVRRWWIRMPRLSQNLGMAQRGRTGVYVSGVKEAGGEVSSISTLDRRRVDQVERGFVSGVVWDSTRYQPLAGANVFLSGTSYSAVSNQDGRFLIEGIRGGVYTAAFTHPRLDTLGVLVPGLEVEVSPGDVAEVILGVPSLGNIVLEACREEESTEGVAVATGVVRDRTSGLPVPGAVVTLSWQEVGGGVGYLEARDVRIEATTDADGRYSTCKLPAGEAVVVQATFMERRSDTVHISVPEGSYSVVDLEIELPPGFLNLGTGAATAGARVRGPQGVQGVQGFIQEPESGEPVREAEVTLRNAPGAQPISGATNQRGFFRLQAPAPGTWYLSAQALGFGGVQDERVEVEPGKLTVLEIRMAPEALELEPLVVTAEARTYHLEMQGFYERQSKGLDTGIFLSPELIEERDPRRVTDLFWGMMGTRVVETQTGGAGVYFRAGERFSGGGVSVCWPMVYLDRHLIRTGGLQGEPAALDRIAEAFDLAAVEVYRSAAEIPAEFNGPNAGCGVIILWTKRGGSGGET